MKLKFFNSVLFFLVFQSSFSQLSQFEDQYLKTFDPQGYSYYQFKKGVSDQGKRIASGLSSKLSSYQNLVTTQDPNDLLADFESKMQNIQNLEANFVKNSNQFAFNTGQQIGNAINNKDAMGAISGLIGFAEARGAQKEAARKLAAQKKALQQQRLKKMSQIYYKAVEFNETKQKEYLSRAAYAENLKDEKYNLAFVENLKCFAKSMRSNFSASSTYWLKNNCSKPSEPIINGIANKFIAKDVQIRKTAERKYKFYEKSGYTEFKDAAISYAASAANTKATAANYFLLGKYYSTENPILGLSTLLTVQEIDPNFKKEEVADLIDNAKNDAEVEINLALKENNVNYINSFLNAGLDRLVKIEGKSVLTEAIALDSPDAVQTILNKYIEGLDQAKINDKIQKTILLCALKNSPKTIKRFADLGVSIDFKIDDYHPIDLAIKGNAPDAYSILLSLSEESEMYKEKYKNSSINIFKNIDNNPMQAAKDIDEITDPEKIKELTGYLFDNLNDNKNILTVLLNSKNAKKYIKNNTTYYQVVKKRFVDDIRKPSPLSKSGAILKSGLISFNKMPVYSDLAGKNNSIKKKKNENKAKSTKDITIEFQLNTVIKGLKEVQEQFGTSNYDNLINFWKEYKTRLNSLKDYEINAVNTSYNAFAGKYGLPKVKSKGITTIKTSFKYKNLDSKSIALNAFAYNNYDLFAAFDKEFDLKQVQENNNKSLFKNMLMDTNKLMSNDNYLSSDFNVKNKSVIQEMIQSLIGNSTYTTGQELAPLVGIMVSFKMENYRISESGGTVLHWYVETLLKEVNGQKSKYKSDHIELLAKGLKIDKNIKNDNGRTAYQLFDSNFSDIKKYWRKANKKALGGGGLINGLANKMMRKDQEEEIEAMLKPTN